MRAREAVSRHRSEEEKGEVRQAMMRAAAELLLERGYEGFSLRKVAERAGFSPGNVYLYFENKDDLLRSAIEDGFRQFGEQLERAARGFPGGLERIAALGRAYIQFGLRNPVHYKLMFMQRTDYLFIERPVPGVEKLRYLEEAVRDAMASGDIRERSVQGVTDALWALAHGVVSLSLAMGFMDEERVGRMAEEAIAMAGRGMLRR
jgi:AcrR family transcriptional regulator